MELFETKCNLMTDYSSMEENIKFIESVEMRELFAHMENGKIVDYEQHAKNPNTWGVYFRYNSEGIDFAGLNPSEWIADFDSEIAATAFKQLIEMLIKSRS
jgi:hypothetical protein